MGPLLSVAVFAAYASAQLTTAIWKFDTPVLGNYTEVGSVIGVSGDRTTLQLSLEGYTNSDLTSTKSEAPAPITVGGLTYVEYTVVAVPAGSSTEVSVVVICSRANERVKAATCMQSLVGAELILQESCGFYSRSEIRTITLTEVLPSRPGRPETTLIETQTDDFRSGMPDYCTNSTMLNELAKRPTTFQESDMATVPVVLTAGLEKLSASAAATLTGTGASAPGMNSGVTPAQTGAAAGSTGAASPINVPALAGIGAAAAAFFL
jgi:hypothetical protein